VSLNVNVAAFSAIKFMLVMPVKSNSAVTSYDPVLKKIVSSLEISEFVRVLKVDYEETAP
jgi:hypothetical protein